MATTATLYLISFSLYIFFVSQAVESGQNTTPHPINRVRDVT